VTAQGTARSTKAFTNWFKDAARAAGLPSDSSPHGLRKAITGHQALAEVKTYTRTFNREWLAREAIDRVVTAFPDRETGKP
jgi:hypothetical protein